ncbi:MAG: hypothetical protein B6I26_06505 [Desulfobacteraceae bacterium 4572_130]|nr:MAG: hypothetical protein B6I26_06505 [Desulfobacteraceae bacterium 4572_130]
MEQKKIHDKETLNTMIKLLNKGIKKFVVIIRHSERHYHTEPLMEPYMGLTEKGKDYAFNLGENLPLNPYPKFFSSYFGRCIETSYLIQKGYIQKHNIFNNHNIIANELSAFYLNDIKKAIAMFTELGSSIFLRKWLEKSIPENIMKNPEKTVNIICNFLITKLNEIDNGNIALCVSHDWNLIPLKEYKLGLTHEKSGDVEFLESVIFFEQQGKYYITNYQKEPQVLKC